MLPNFLCSSLEASGVLTAQGGQPRHGVGPVLFLSVPCWVMVMIHQEQPRVGAPAPGRGFALTGYCSWHWNKRDGVKVGLVLVFPCPSITP